MEELISWVRFFFFFFFFFGEELRYGMICLDGLASSAMDGLGRTYVGARGYREK